MKEIEDIVMLLLLRGGYLILRGAFLVLHIVFPSSYGVFTTQQKI